MAFSKKLQEKLKKDNATDVVLDYMHKKSLFSTLVTYAINWLNRFPI